MKRKSVLFLVCFALSFLLIGCQCKHDWVPADCTTAKTCVHCKETIGEPLGHDWSDATCTTPAVCSRCGANNGQALGHSWIPAVNLSGIEGRICTECQEYQMPTSTWTPLTECEKYSASNEEAHFQDVVIGDWQTHAGKLPDAIRFCVANKESYKHTHFIIYELKEKYNWLSGLISYSDKSEKYAEAQILIYLDNELAYESNWISETSLDDSFTLDVEGVDVVRVVCYTTEKHIAYCALSASVY